MKLPNAESAFINIDKLRNYSLNPNHDRGKHKARLFAAILGLTVQDTEELQALIRDAIQSTPVVMGLCDEYGQRYIVDFSVTRNQNVAIVRTTWIIRPTETFPRLVSCFIKRSS